MIPTLEQLAHSKPADLFPGARAPEAAVAGVYVYYSLMDEAHRAAQEIDTPEGAFWHGIVHRREPDPGNAAYWFRRVGRHAIFPALRDAAATHISVGAQWDPFAFIDLYERARRDESSELWRAVREVEEIEWRLLFDWCAGASHGQ